MEEMEKRYDYQKYEQQVQQKWEKDQTYTQENNAGPLYSIDTPPPTVSGTLHIGHIFSYTQTDIIARYKRMSGFSVFYPFGFDDNGLPTERYVEKKADVRAHEMSRSQFINLCIKEAGNAACQFKELWQRMGLSVDWRLTYSTISPQSRKISQESFIELLRKRYVYRKQEPALYCTTCRTSVAQAELDDKQVPSLFTDIIFKDSDGNDRIISTTRPELIPACVAVLYHPNDIRYGKLHGKKAITPLFDKEVPFLSDELVDKDKGTGLVMVCTFGDKTDIIWYKKHNLPYYQAIGLDGKCTAMTGFLKGLTVIDARKAILERLKEHNLISAQKEIVHAVGIHERCKKEIEYTILPQWFVSILPYKEEFLLMAHAIEWYPAFMKTRYNDWVENIAWDWCISRQRFFGIPFPAWHCQDCGQILLARHDQLPIDPQESAYDGKCTACSSTNITPDTDVMDTWNTSSLTPYICKNLYQKNGFLPMSMRPQAHDIIRTWAFDTIVKEWMHNGSIPWKTIVISGHVLANAQEKLSKKEGTALDPITLLEKYPADAIRYWTASGRLGTDIIFSQEQLMVGQKLITKLWNAFRFAQQHIQAVNTTSDTGWLDHDQEQQSNELNKWLLDTISTCFEKYQQYFDQYEVGLALNTIEQFFWHDFCDNYIELIKNQLFNPEQYAAYEVQATRWTLHHAGVRILQMYAPFIPHVTELLFEQVYTTQRSLHQTKYSDIQILYSFPHATQIINNIITIVAQVRKLKSENKLSLKTELTTLTVYSLDAALDDLKHHEQLLKGVTQATTIIYAHTQRETSLLQKDNEEWHAHVIVT